MREFSAYVGLDIHKDTIAGFETVSDVRGVLGGPVGLWTDPLAGTGASPQAPQDDPVRKWIVTRHASPAT